MIDNGSLYWAFGGFELQAKLVVEGLLKCWPLLRVGLGAGIAWRCAARRLWRPLEGEIIT